MTTFEEVLAMAALPERVVPLIVAGKHIARIAELERQLAIAPAPQSLGDANPRRVIGEEIAQLQEQMRGSEVDFQLRAMPGKQWDRFKFLEPKKAKDEADEAFVDRFFTWMCALVSLTVVEPAMTPTQVAELVDKLPGSSWDTLSNACWSLNSGTVAVPFSPAAWLPTMSSEPQSRPPSESASPPPASAAKSQPKRRRTSTTKPAD